MLNKAAMQNFISKIIKVADHLFESKNRKQKLIHHEIWQVRTHESNKTNIHPTTATSKKENKVRNFNLSHTIVNNAIEKHKIKNRLNLLSELPSLHQMEINNGIRSFVLEMGNKIIQNR